MIITLKGAKFTTNIGTLSTYSIRFVGSGVTNSNTSVDRESNTGYTTTITLAEGYELDGAITVTMGITDITSTAVSGLTITIPTKVTGNVVINVPTKNTAGGEVAEPETPDVGGDEEATTIRYALAPKNIVTGKLVNKTTGASEESSSSRYNEYTVDAAWILYADGYNASETAKSGGVTYFDAADTYLGYDALGEDSYGAEFEGELLTVPAGTTTVKVLSSVGKIDPALYRETVGTWTAITKDSSQVGKVTNKETGELEDSSGGRYTSYTVEDSWILCADGYASSKSAAVSYFDVSGNYLGYDSLGGLSGVVFEKVTLSVPSGTTTVRVQAAAANQSMALYRLV